MGRDHLSWIEYTCIFIGIWPKNAIKNTLHRKMYAWHQLFSNSYHVLFTMGMIIQLVRLLVAGADFDDVFENLSLTILFTLTSVKLYVCSHSNKAPIVPMKIRKYERKVEACELTKKQLKIYRFYQLYLRGLYLLGLCMAILLVFQYSVFPKSYDVSPSNHLNTTSKNAIKGNVPNFWPSTLRKISWLFQNIRKC